ncbi:MAG: cystathionine gamma-synthase family protein [Proteobacteria bacterium]|nr:cystathionine gamma-synthase family protein [Pseudomonadota bacterium]
MKSGFVTRVLHSDLESPIEHNAVHKPMHVAMAYGYKNAREIAEVFQGRKPGYVYGRQGNPTSTALESRINKMEEGVATATFSSGMAAIAGTLLPLLHKGDHLIASRFLFSNTSSFFGTLADLGIDISYVDVTDVALVAAAIGPRTRAVFVETIANPRTQVADLENIGQFCAERGLLYIVDSTMTSPWLFQPKTVGAGLIIHSLTKYISGHGNALGGSVTDTGCFDWRRFPNIHEAYKTLPPEQWGITQIRKKGLRDCGATLSPESAHRIAVGSETLGLRTDRACDNALRLAQWLEAHPAVARVYYPGLPSHAQHALATKLFKGYGIIISFELIDRLDCFDFLDRLQMVICSTHLADTRTLAIPAAQTIFWEMGPQARAEMGIADSLIRLSVGIEDFDDLVADFEQALV